MSLEQFIENRIEEIKDNLSEVFDSLQNFKNVAIALFVAIILIKPTFQLSVLTGIFFLITLFWLFLFKASLFIENPKYILVVFGLSGIRWAMGDVAGEGFLFLKTGDWVSAGIYLLTWVVVYAKTKEIQRH